MWLCVLWRVVVVVVVVVVVESGGGGGGGVLFAVLVVWWMPGRCDRYRVLYESASLKHVLQRA